MSRKILFIILATLLFLSATIATAAENLDEREPSSNYIVTPSHDTESGIVDTDIGILTVSDSVSQGETNLHGKYVGSGLTLLAVYLNWGDSTDSLRLKIYTPSVESTAKCRIKSIATINSHQIFKD